MSNNIVHPKHIGYAWSPDKLIRPCILSVMRSICETGFIGRHESPEWILDYSYTPFGFFKAGAESASWKERHAFEAHLYLPGTQFWEDTSMAGVAQTRGIFISFRGDFAFNSTFARTAWVCFSDPSQRLGDVLERLLEIGLTMGSAGFSNAQAVFWEAIALLNSAGGRGREIRSIPAKDETPPLSDFLQKARAYLHEHLAERVTREDLANHLKMSVSALAHQYQDQAGEALMTTLARMRIHVVKSLLLKGEPLKLVAAQTGFYDEFHLSRTFKRFEGISPSAFRRRMQRSGPARLVL